MTKILQTQEILGNHKKDDEKSLTQKKCDVIVSTLQQNLQPGLSTPKTSYGDTYTRQRVFLCHLSAHTQIMVAQAGPTSVGPVSVGAGVENPAWATTI